jgi:uncharacterized membrane protein (DUF4010 family)
LLNFVFDGFHFETFWNFVTALLIGALIGIEREKHKTSDNDPTIGGVRTFMLCALVGAMGGWLAHDLRSPWPLVAAVLAVVAPVVAAYGNAVRRRPEDMGLTTELAAVATTLLGALTMSDQRELGAALGVGIASILFYKQPLHGLVAQLDREDIYAGLRLLIATFIVLPLLPDKPVDPWGALNPWSLWVLVLLISALGLVGYVATRLLGKNRGTALTALTGGVVSSTAVTLFFARQSRDAAYEKAARTLASGVLVAWGVMCVRVVIEVLVVNRALLSQIATPFAAMTAVAAAFAWLYYRGSRSDQEKVADVPLRNPFSLTSAIKFAALFAAVLLVVKLTQPYAPPSGLYVVAALAGTTDVDAITLSMAKYAQGGDPETAAHAIVIATVTNTAVKAGMVVALGSASLRKPVLMAAAAMIVAGIGTVLAF